VMALSTYLPLAATLAAEAHPANAAVPVFMAHGSHDPIVPLAAGERSCERLRALGYEVDWRSYPMPHSLCAEEVEDLREFLIRALPPRA
jgi:phospholipase/carboxylesterase